MPREKPIQIVDLFAGPGGLGEGFSAYEDRFQILVSAEMESSAHATLTLRAYFRTLKREAPHLLDSYYDFCNGVASSPTRAATEEFWIRATNEARQITLGTEEGNRELDQKIKEGLDRSRNWVLIGGPPCQAYSLVGRARNQGKTGYEAENDHRHFLYREYLRIIAEHGPAVFVMENVKGILSSTVGGKRIFHDILRDLASPQRAVEDRNTGEQYVICSLTTGETFHPTDSPEDFDVSKFIIRAEEYGIPQARHRVILLGIKESLYKKFNRLEPQNTVSVEDAIASCPPLRSKLSRKQDNDKEWYDTFHNNLQQLITSLDGSLSALSDLSTSLRKLRIGINEDLTTGSIRSPKFATEQKDVSPLAKWYSDERLKVWLNHDSRGHMETDLLRYLFASSFAEHFKVSPKGARDFALPELRPNHKNWESGKFADRFRVQVKDKPASTVTSHISKDGHYFIHYDPSQCRSLTVREAARLQTFQDNYFFCGNRTQQYHQVGNAVPPLLAYKIAKVVAKILEHSE